MIQSILIPIISITVIAFILGIAIYLVSKIFYVYENPLISTINKMLPGVNCGACGYPGCSGLAKALVETRDPTKVCPVGGAELAEQIGAVLGIKMGEIKPIVATVLCQGNYKYAKPSAAYLGIHDCWAVKNVYHGPKICPYSCIGLGSCVDACKYDAIHIIDGVAKVDEDKCVGCGACVQACPIGCIEMHEKRADRYFVACRSKDKGGITKKYCEIGCIGCKRCEKVCKFDAIKVIDFCAYIDQSKCTGCGECFKVCPTHSIVHMHSENLTEKAKKGDLTA